MSDDLRPTTMQQQGGRDEIDVLQQLLSQQQQPASAVADEEPRKVSDAGNSTSNSPAASSTTGSVLPHSSTLSMRPFPPFSTPQPRDDRPEMTDYLQLARTLSSNSANGSKGSLLAGGGAHQGTSSNQANATDFGNIIQSLQQQEQAAKSNPAPQTSSAAAAEFSSIIQSLQQKQAAKSNPAPTAAADFNSIIQSMQKQQATSNPVPTAAADFISIFQSVQPQQQATSNPAPNTAMKSNINSMIQTFQPQQVTSNPVPNTAMKADIDCIIQSLQQQQQICNNINNMLNQSHQQGDLIPLMQQNQQQINNLLASLTSASVPESTSSSSQFNQQGNDFPFIADSQTSSLTASHVNNQVGMMMQNGMMDHSSTSSSSVSNQQPIKKDAGWEEQFKAMQAYQLEFGNCRVPSRCDAKPKLGRWVMTQRRQFTLLAQGLPSALTADRIRRLDEIGFTWSVRPEPKAHWNKKFTELQGKIFAPCYSVTLFLNEESH